AWGCPVRWDAESPALTVRGFLLLQLRGLHPLAYVGDTAAQALLAGRHGDQGPVREFLEWASFPYSLSLVRSPVRMMKAARLGHRCPGVHGALREAPASLPPQSSRHCRYSRHAGEDSAVGSRKKLVAGAARVIENWRTRLQQRPTHEHRMTELQQMIFRPKRPRWPPD